MTNEFPFIFYAYLKPRLRVVPVRPDNSGVLAGQVRNLDLVLLGALVLHIVTVGAGEEDLSGVVDVAAHVEFTFLENVLVNYSTFLD